MINIMNFKNNNCIYILSKNGNKELFNSEKLYSNLVFCCRRIDIKNLEIAEDISNAVENALYLQYKNKNRIFSEIEINLLLTDILENSGFFELSEEYKEYNKIIDYINITQYDTLYNFIKLKYNLFDNELEFISEKIFELYNVINFDELPVSLITELIKFYRQFITKDSLEVKRDITINNNLIKNKIRIDDITIFSRSDLLNIFLKQDREFINSNIIDISGINKIFPSIKLKFNFIAFIEYFKLKTMITDIVLFARINEIIPKIKNIIELILNFLNKQNKNNINSYSIFIRFIDIYDFIYKYCIVEKNRIHKFCEELSNYFIGRLPYNIIIRGMKDIN